MEKYTIATNKNLVEVQCLHCRMSNMYIRKKGMRRGEKFQYIVRVFVEISLCRVVVLLLMGALNDDGKALETELKLNRCQNVKESFTVKAETDLTVRIQGRIAENGKAF